MSAEWRRVLWQQQPYPDNHVPNSFLKSLRRNPNFKPYEFVPLVLGSLAISQHVSTIFAFLLIFIRLNEHTLDPRRVVWSSGGGFLVGYVVWEMLERRDGHKGPLNRSKIVKSSILVFLVLMALSPVLRTLSAATSSDSIWALTAVLFILNVLLADYTPAQRMHGQERLSSVLSMNAATSASVVLASRLADGLSVFALVLCAIEVFALYPMLRRMLQGSSDAITCILTIAWAASAMYMAAAHSTTVAGLLLAILISISFVGPAVLVWAQKFKNELRGPWDVAVPRIN